MADGKEEAKGSLTIPEALSLKHELGKAIIWKGLTAIEVVSLTEMTAERWRKVYHDYDEWYHRKGMAGLGLALPVAVLAIGAGLYLLKSGEMSHYGGMAALLGGGWLLWRLASRRVRREAYAEGYEAGLEQGVCRTLGISDEEALGVWDLAREMELDADILEGLAKQQKQPAPE